MVGNNKCGQTTRCTAIACKDGKICLRETEYGLQLPGGYAHWKYGFPGAVQELLYAEHGINFEPAYLRSMIQHRTPEGLSVIDLAVTGNSTNRTNAHRTYWFTPDDALRQNLNAHDRSTLELHALGTIKVPLDFIRVTGQSEQLSHMLAEPPTIRKPQQPIDFIVSGGPIRYRQKARSAVYAFQQLSNDAGDGKLSFFGGTAEEDELPHQTIKREINEEGGGKLVVEQRGLLGVRINNVTGPHQSEKYAVNFSIANTTSEKTDEILGSGDIDTVGITWLDLGRIMDMPEDKFRTRDTRALIELMESILQRRGKFMPLDLVKKV
ncbi:MAG TPA: NUDIX domain-containing protein [Candidatus Nanoarchaeia archaeon]|nr:NUDIX domain-containing protein [Candidatus Nanoarchaeia archaeon]